MVRTYGSAPYGVAVLHGGPGTPGYMAPVGRKLGRDYGVLEPIQSQDSLAGQIEELKTQIDGYYSQPLTIVASSWGSILSLLFTAKHSEYVKKLILVGSAELDVDHLKKAEALRRKRMSKSWQSKLDLLTEQVKNSENPDLVFAQIGRMIFESDSYNPTERLEIIEHQYEVSQKVLAEFEAFRDQEGLLSEELRKIDVPIVTIHGDYDPRALEGIEPFLQDHVAETRVHILSKCGHYPWVEKHAKGQFFDLLSQEISGSEDIFTETGARIPRLQHRENTHHP